MKQARSASFIRPWQGGHTSASTAKVRQKFYPWAVSGLSHPLLGRFIVTRRGNFVDNLILNHKSLLKRLAYRIIDFADSAS